MVLVNKDRPKGCPDCGGELTLVHAGSHFIMLNGEKHKLTGKTMPTHSLWCKNEMQMKYTV